VPADHGFWRDHRQGRKCRRNQPAQPNEQQAIDVVEGRSLWRLAPKHVFLVAKYQDLRFTPCAGPEQPNERTTKQSQQLNHRPTASSDSHWFASCVEFSTGTGANTKQSSLLTGMIFDEAGERLTPTWSVKKGTRYRYYVSTSLVTGAGRTRSSRRRIPAGNLETMVLNRLRTLLASRGELIDATDNETDDGAGRGRLMERGRQIADELGQTPEKARAILMALVRRVEVRPDCIKIDISQSRLAAFLASTSVDLPIQHQNQTDSSDRILTLTAPVRLKRIGREMNLLVANSDDNAAADMGLLRIVARAHDIQTRVAQDTSLSVHDIAREERVTAAYIYTLLRLPWLAPDITTAIVNGRQPPQLNAKKLMRLTAHLPGDWAEQRALFGFR
jgi:hypothetical protein